jgi:DedD protein
MGLITEETDEPGRASRGLGRRARTDNRVDSEEAEITLGMRSLLGIFFGLVLICGIFFGLGYSVGRSGGAHVESTDETAGANPAANSNLKKPSADQSLTPAPEPMQTAAETTQTPPATNPPDAEQTAASAPATAATSAPPAATSPAPAPRPSVAAAQPAVPAPQRPQVATTQPATAPLRTQMAAVQQATQGAPQVQTVAATMPPSNFMVQIAAVRLQTDATVLVGALQRRGYHVVVRNEPTDALLHVQVGPFTSRIDANNMRAKLLADGYNAVVK